MFRPNTRKYGPEITPYLDTFHAVKSYDDYYLNVNNAKINLMKISGSKYEFRRRRHGHNCHSIELNKKKVLYKKQKFLEEKICLDKTMATP